VTKLRELRSRTTLSQTEFAAWLGVPTETFRVWDAGRRPVPNEVLDRAREVAEAMSPGRRYGLPELSRLLGVSVFRLREAARDGRLVVTYANRAVYGRPLPRATLAAGEAYKRDYYGKRARWSQMPPAPELLAPVPPNYDQVLRELRALRCLSQTELAMAIGAAGRAVIYQWETRKRRPTSSFWRRILRLSTFGQP
jgi:DNA-binding transcriptional regulator YiaG